MEVYKFGLKSRVFRLYEFYIYLCIRPVEFCSLEFYNIQSKLAILMKFLTGILLIFLQLISLNNYGK